MHKRVVCGGGGVWCRGVGGWVGCRRGGHPNGAGTVHQGIALKKGFEECSGKAQTTPSRTKAASAPQRCRRGSLPDSGARWEVLVPGRLLQLLQSLQQLRTVQRWVVRGTAGWQGSSNQAGGQERMAGNLGWHRWQAFVHGMATTPRNSLSCLPWPHRLCFFGARCRSSAGQRSISAGREEQRGVEGTSCAAKSEMWGVCPKQSGPFCTIFRPAHPQTTSHGSAKLQPAGRTIIDAQQPILLRLCQPLLLPLRGCRAGQGACGMAQRRSGAGIRQGRQGRGSHPANCA